MTQCPNCFLLHQLNHELVERENDTFFCSNCSRCCKPIRLPSAVEKLLELPNAVQELAIELISSENESDFLFYTGDANSFPRWEMAGMGRSKNYPTELQFLHLPGNQARIIMRHGVMESYGRDEMALSAPVFDEAIKQRTIFVNVTTRLQKQELQYLGMEGPRQLQRFVFGKSFQHENTEHGLITIVQMSRS